MSKSQAIADLSLALSRVTTADQSATLIRRALRVTGLTNASTISPLDIDALLEALAAEGRNGPVPLPARSLCPALCGLVLLLATLVP